MIKLRFTTLDGIRKTKRFKTLAGARKAAHEWVGKSATVARWYAVSDDGVVKVTAEGCKLTDIWPDSDEGDCDDGQGPRESYETGGGEFDPGADYDAGPPRPTGCTCSDYQLIQVGCDCGAATRNNDEIPF